MAASAIMENRFWGLHLAQLLFLKINYFIFALTLKLKIFIMKKVLLTIGGLVIASVLIVTFAEGGKKCRDQKKQAVEVKKEMTGSSCGAPAAMKSCAKEPAACPKAKCEEACKSGDTKCNPEACKSAANCPKSEGSCAKMESKACCNKASQCTGQQNTGGNK